MNGQVGVLDLLRQLDHLRVATQRQTRAVAQHDGLAFLRSLGPLELFELPDHLPHHGLLAFIQIIVEVEVQVQRVLQGGLDGPSDVLHARLETLLDIRSGPEDFDMGTALLQRLGQDASVLLAVLRAEDRVLRERADLDSQFPLEALLQRQCRLETRLAGDVVDLHKGPAGGHALCERSGEELGAAQVEIIRRVTLFGEGSELQGFAKGAVLRCQVAVVRMRLGLGLRRVMLGVTRQEVRFVEMDVRMTQWREKERRRVIIVRWC